jgi:putative MFS transporter
LVLKIGPADASFLVIWFGVAGIAGRLFCAWLSDAAGRRPSVVFVCVMAALATSLSGYWSDAHLGTISVFYIMVLVAGFFGGGLYAIVGPYMAEVWPSKLRSSGMGLGYGVGNLGKFIGPAGLAVIAGSSNYVSPKATLDALVPGMNFFAFWYVLGALAIWFIGFETRGRTIEEIDRALTAKVA